MYQAIQALDSTKFKHFMYTLQIIQKYPSTLQEDKKIVTDAYPMLVEIALTVNERLTYQLTSQEILDDIQKLHAEYLEILKAFELDERRESHVTAKIDTNGQAYFKASGRYGQDASMAL